MKTIDVAYDVEKEVDHLCELLQAAANKQENQELTKKEARKLAEDITNTLLSLRNDIHNLDLPAVITKSTERGHAMHQLELQVRRQRRRLDKSNKLIHQLDGALADMNLALIDSERREAKLEKLAFGLSDLMFKD